jgi:hypothetical protein
MELDARGTIGELAEVSVLEPVFRRLHGIKRNVSPAAVHSDFGEAVDAVRTRGGINVAKVCRCYPIGRQTLPDLLP